MHNKCGGLTAACFSIVLLSSVGGAFNVIPEHQVLSPVINMAQARLAGHSGRAHEIVTASGDIVDLKTMSESSTVRVGCGPSISPQYVGEISSGSTMAIGWLGAFIISLIAFICLPARRRQVVYGFFNSGAIFSLPFVSMFLPTPFNYVVSGFTTVYAFGYVLYLAVRSLYGSVGLFMRRRRLAHATAQAVQDAVRRPIHPCYPNQRRSNTYVNSGCPKRANKSAGRISTFLAR